VKRFTLLLLFGLLSVQSLLAADVTEVEQAFQVAPMQQATAEDLLTAEQIMHESLLRHDLYPYVYEEQTLVLMDRHKQRDVRRIKRYSRLEADGSFKSLLEFVHPDSLAGSALLFLRSGEDQQSSRILLPALGPHLIEYQGGMSGGQMLGSEFTIEDLVPEDMALFQYQRDEDVVDHDEVYFVVLATMRPEHAEAEQSFYERKIFIRQDNYAITRIDYFDHKSRLLKRQTRHDIHRVGGGMWRANMIAVENMLNGHRSILKIDRRVYSRDYVPNSIFTEEHLLAAAGQLALAVEEEAAATVEVSLPDVGSDRQEVQP